MQGKYNLFFDSSVLISALNSPYGGAGIVLSACRAGEFSLYVSDQVLEEVERNIQEKFPLIQKRFINFILSRPTVVSGTSLLEIRHAHALIKTNDAPILAAAIKVKPDFLITWDIKHFLKASVVDAVSFTICTPQDFIRMYWKR